MADAVDPAAELPEPYDDSWREEFWAGKPSYSDEFAGEVTKRWQAFYEDAEGSGLVTRWARSYRAYHGLSQDGAAATLGIRFGGQRGELASLEANQYRMLVKHVLALGTSGRPAFDARATNNDHRSAAQVKLARDAIEYYLHSRGTERKLKLVAEVALVFGVGFLHQYWDQNAGPDSAMGGKAGDVVHQVLTPLDVAYERGRDLAEANWWLVRDWQNRYDLCATYPDLADDILAVEESDDFGSLAKHRVGSVSEQPDDSVPVFWFYHRRTQSLPEGRHAILVGDVVVYDGPLPYEDCPVHAMQPSTFLGSDLGYADAWDILGLNELHSGILSALTTRAAAFAVPNVVTGEGGVSATELKGMRLLKISARAGQEPVLPQLLELFSVPEEVFRTLEFASGMMAATMGINSVVAGTNQSDVKSGSHAALMQSMAIQFQSGFQASWAFLLEAFGSGLVRLLKRFVREERLMALAGVQGRSSVEAFSGEDLSGIDRVTIDLGNPMSRTAAGRHEIAKEMLMSVVQPGSMVKTPEQYLNAISTGRLDPLFDGPSSQIELTKSENESLSRGQPVEVIVFERHDLHVQEHLTLLNDPSAKADVRLVDAVLTHVQQHFEHWSQLSASSPQILAAIQCPPLPMPAPGPMPGPGGGPPGMGGGAPPGGPGAPPPGAGGGPPPGPPSETAQVDTPMGATGDLPAMPDMPEQPAPPAPTPA